MVQFSAQTHTFVPIDLVGVAEIIWKRDSTTTEITTAITITTAASVATTTVATIATSTVAAATATTCKTTTTTAAAGYGFSKSRTDKQF